MRIIPSSALTKPIMSLFGPILTLIRAWSQYSFHHDRSRITDHCFFHRGVGRGGELGRGRGVGVGLGVGLGVGVGVGVGTGTINA